LSISKIKLVPQISEIFAKVSGKVLRNQRDLREKNVGRLLVSISKVKLVPQISEIFAKVSGKVLRNQRDPRDKTYHA